jgi:hypothetical protein
MDGFQSLLACITATTERYDSRYDRYGSAAITPANFAGEGLP